MSHQSGSNLATSRVMAPGQGKATLAMGFLEAQVNGSFFFFFFFLVQKRA